ncbi:hypothetical protein LUZ63_008407 [Rhynchospora breviuscula]|uniref:FAR1 domain-containing protein n=1 Tax=Rhynchospora breviuscula TaxID=2022672 RepID=A0A9Q0CTJ3_9POAL|nr:hypothetical protein LUZ63_008407 [Rhynchospora breviuscula]
MHQPYGENDWISQLGLEFETEEQVWQLWNRYGGKMGFSARRHYAHKSRVDSIIMSRVFVCSNEGHQKEKQGDNSKNPLAETRTGARLAVKFIREKNHYRVVDFVSDHNHLLQEPEACHMIRSQREVTELSQLEIDLADESGIRPKQAYELMDRQVGGQTNLSITIIDYRNYLRDKRRRILIFGEAVAMLKYFNDRTLENPSFHHAEQVDEIQEITNIIWADARMIADYARFGDVVAFDTTFEEAKFEEAFSELKANVKDDNDWLSKIYKLKEKWANCYMKNALSLGMRSTQLSESINSDIKNYLNSDLDIIRFFKNFERIVDDKRHNEKCSEFE